MMNTRDWRLASCLVNARREQRILEAAYYVIDYMLDEPDRPVPELIKRYAKYHKVRIAEVEAVVKRLTEAMDLNEF